MTHDRMNVRPERAADIERIHEVLTAAFGTPLEATLVDRLRAHGRLTIGLVAERDGEVVGHVAFSPITIGAAWYEEATDGLGLGPVGVTPDRQRAGVGAALIRAGLEACRQCSVPVIAVLGDPGYYERFGFERASRLGIGNEYGADDAFMVIVHAADSIPIEAPRVVRYPPEFAEVGA